MMREEGGFLIPAMVDEAQGQLVKGCKAASELPRTEKPRDGSEISLGDEIWGGVSKLTNGRLAVQLL